MLLKLLSEQANKKPVQYFGIFAASLGTVQILKSLFKTFKIAFNAVRPERDLISRYGKCYVLITGGSDGLGKALAEQFAKRGFNLILVARDEARLKATQLELSQKYGVDVQIKAFDLAKEQNFNMLREEFQHLDIGILVNNAGVLYSGKIQEQSQEYIYNTVNLNVLAPTLLINVFGKQLESRQQRSAIINISSLAAKFDRANLVVYGASKAYLSSLSRSAMLDLNNVDTLNCMPGPIDTLMIRKGFKSTFFGSLESKLYLSTANQTAQSILSKLGYQIDTRCTLKHTLRHLTYTHAMPFYNVFIKSM